jgi:hypothetical protein
VCWQALPSLVAALLLCFAGLLASISACLSGLVQHTQQHLASTTAERGDWTGPLVQLLGTFVLDLLRLWQSHIATTSALVPAVVRTLLPLVQQLQSCGPQLMEVAAAAAAGSAYQQNCSRILQTTVVEVQQAAAVVLCAIDPLDKEITGELPLEVGVAQQVQDCLDDPAVVQLLLQDLICSTSALHQHHEAYLQQQQQQQETIQLQAQQHHRTPAASSSSSSSSMNKSNLQQQHSVKQQLCAHLLPIPAYHRDVLHLLPGGQAYLDAAIRASSSMGEGDQHTKCMLYAGNCSYAVYRYLVRSFDKPAQQQQQQQAALLSAAGVRLVLELQLLAAAEYQRCQQQMLQQTITQGQLTSLTTVLLTNSTRLLHTLIRAAAQASGSSLRPEVLQQAGLQLLQALAAPLQQLQLCRHQHLLEYTKLLFSYSVDGHMGEACHALITAACGPAGPDPDSELRRMCLLHFGC